jgi:hypothetical protein
MARLKQTANKANTTAPRPAGTTAAQVLADAKRAARLLQKQEKEAKEMADKEQRQAERDIKKSEGTILLSVFIEYTVIFLDSYLCAPYLSEKPKLLIKSFIAAASKKREADEKKGISATALSSRKKGACLIILIGINQTEALLFAEVKRKEMDEKEESSERAKKEEVLEIYIVGRK